MYWKIGLSSIVILAIAIPATLYYGSLDWSRAHATRVSALPILSDKDNEGEFRIKASGFEFRAHVAGMQNQGENVILLHGFPESSAKWAALMKPLADAGYRVVAYDQRGYSPGARPDNVEDYHVSKLSADVVAIADQVGFERFHLVGHDWGSGAGWSTVFNYAERVISWTGMAIPHFGSFTHSALHDPEQAKRSGYFKTFKKPMLVEFAMTHSGQKRMKAMMGRMPGPLLEDYLAIFAEPGAMTAMLNWYRAWDHEAVDASGEMDIDVHTPTLFIWGNQDGVVARSSVEAQKVYMKGPYHELELDAGHALLLTKPDEVIGAVLGHIGEYSQ